jgi:hypothetical protein
MRMMKSQFISARQIIGLVVICIGFGLTAPVSLAEEPQAVSSGKPSEAAAQARVLKGGATVDLAYAPPDGFGLMILRPAAFFQLPDMKSLAGIANDFIATKVLHLDDRKKLTLSVDSIEQITGEFVVTKTDRGWTGGPRPRVIRMTEPFDWKKQFQALASVFDPPDYVMANDRTMVLGPEANCQQRRSASSPAFICCPGWKEVENCIAVCVLNNSRSQWTKELDPALKDFESEAEGRKAVRSIRDLNYVIIGIDLSPGLVVKAFLNFKTEQAARSLFDLYEASLPEMRKALQEAGKPKIDNEVERAIVYAEIDLVRNASVRREGNVITVRSSAKVALADQRVQQALASLIASR